MGVKTLPSIAAALIAGGQVARYARRGGAVGHAPHQRTVTATLATLADEIATARADRAGDHRDRRRRVAARRDRLVRHAAAVRQAHRRDARAIAGRVAQRASRRTRRAGDRDAGDAGRAARSRAAARGARSATGIRLGGVHESERRADFLGRAARRRARRALARRSEDRGGRAGDGAALLDRGLAVDVSPDRFVAEALLDALRDRRDVRGVRVLYAAAEGARETLQDGLEELGAVVDHVVMYRSTVDGEGAAALRERLLNGDVDLVTFTSASSVNAFVDAVGADAAQRAPAVTIGPITTAAARARGLEVRSEAVHSTICRTGRCHAIIVC